MAITRAKKEGINPKLQQRFSLGQTDKKILKTWYSLLTLGRMLDERAPNYLKQALGWSYHAPYAGHDGIQLAIGQVFVLNTDHLFPYYRDMLTCLSAGLTAEEIILNGISKATDPASGGRHMSNHFAKPEWNIHNVSSCTGNHILHAVGVARAMKKYGHSGVAICSQGESSTSEGYVYEAINGASREELPCIFVFQDNGYGISVPKREQTANEFAADNFTGFKNLRIIHCDGKDIFDSINAMSEARAHALEKGQPVIVHAHCIRIHEHSNSDKHELYRSKKELEEAAKQDPFHAFKKLLVEKENFKVDELSQIDAQMREVILEAHTAAVSAPNPTAESIYDYVIPPAYECRNYPDGLHNLKEGVAIKLIDALNSTLKAEFRRNPHTYIWGQDMANGEKGGVFNVSKNMQKEFGSERVFNAPIAEDFIVGTANGMSRFRSDIRIVIEGAEFADYFWPAMEQLVETSHDYWRSNGKFSPNITIRLASGGYIGGGIYHSQNIEGTLTTFPGIRVVVPSFADDAAGLLRTCLRSQGVTLYLEPKALYNAKGPMHVVPEDFEVPFGKCRIRKQGTNLSLITYGNTVHHCLLLAEELERDGYSIEVIDLRSLRPLDTDGIYKSVKKTNRVVIAHEDKIFGGFGGEIAGLISENCFEYLDAPIKRVGSEDTPVGFNRILERAILPNSEKIKKVVLEVLKY